MKKIRLFLIMLLVGIQAAFAQSVQVSGKVTYADDGAPVIGATINVKGTSIATLSDVNGDYKLTIPANQNKVLVVNYTGLVSQEIETPTSGVYNVALKTDALLAEDVVVTGYGNVSRKNYAGSAAVVATDKLKDVPTVSVADRLAGNVAGLTITSTSGQPGSAEKIRIRGMGSINAGNEPLIVLDGVPMTSGDFSVFTYSGAGNSVLATINPNDIETMSVIKDAAAASLYGSRAANGVIVITTKKGTAGKTRFNVKADLGFSDMAIDWRPVLNGADRRQILHLGFYNQGIYNGGMTHADATAYADENIDDFAAPVVKGGDPNDPNNYTNWSDLILRNGFNQNYEVSAQGGNDKTKFFASLGYTDQKGITYNSEFKRISGRVNLEHKQGILTLNLSSSLSSTDQKVEGDGGLGINNPLRFISSFGNPSDRAYNEDGTINTTTGFKNYGDPKGNPLNTREVNYDKNSIIKTFNMASAQLDLFKGFAIKETLSYDFNNITSKVWWDPRSQEGAAANGVMQIYNRNIQTFTSQTMATYNRLFADVHSLNALVAFEIENYNDSYTYANGSGFPSFKKNEISNASTTRAASYIDGSSLMSVVAKVDYTYDNRLYVGGSYRRDGSSRLAPNNRWGDFWSVSSFWRISNEKWYQNGGIKNVLTDARIRASYGENGTQPSSFYSWMGTYGYGYNYAGNPGMTESRIPNPELKWEKNLSTNVGVDLTFIDRITLGVEWYNRDTKDLIMPEPISLTTGFSSTLKNIGSMNNQGIEAEIRAIAIQTKDVSWTIGLNLSHNVNKLTSLSEGQTEIIGLNNWIHRVGNSYYSFYLREYAGVDSKTGAESFYVNKENPDGTFSRDVTTNASKANLIVMDNINPYLNGGLNSQFTYKWLDFGFTFTYQLGGHALNDDYSGNSNGVASMYNRQVPSFHKIDQMWRKPGDIASQPLFMYGSGVNEGSNRFLVSTDYLRLKNITLGFSAPKEWTKKLSIEKLRIFASASNLFTIKDKNCTIDPETPIGGFVQYQSPQMRVVTFGLEIGF